MANKRKVDTRDKENEYNEELYEALLQSTIPTQADLERVMTDDELKELCIRKPCCVRMNEWNPVYDYHRKGLKQGKLQNRSQNFINRYLAKVGLRFIQQNPDMQLKIEECRAEAWKLRKKDSLSLLELWAYQREKSKEPPTSAVNLNPSSESPQPGILTESVAPESSLASSEERPSPDETAEASYNKELLNNLNEVFNTESLELSSQSSSTKPQESQTQDILPNTESFGEGINCTSTQASNQQSEFIDVETSI